MAGVLLHDVPINRMDTLTRGVGRNYEGFGRVEAGRSRAMVRTTTRGTHSESSKRPRGGGGTGLGGSEEVPLYESRARASCIMPHIARPSLFPHLTELLVDFHHHDLSLAAV